MKLFFILWAIFLILTVCLAISMFFYESIIAIGISPQLFKAIAWFIILSCGACGAMLLVISFFIKEK